MHWRDIKKILFQRNASLQVECVYMFLFHRSFVTHQCTAQHHRKKIHQFWCLLAVSAVAAAAVLLFFLCIVNNSTALVGDSVYFSKCWAYVLYETSTELLIALHKKEAISDPFPKWNTFLFFSILSFFCIRQFHCADLLVEILLKISTMRRSDLFTILFNIWARVKWMANTLKCSENDLAFV